MTRRPARRGRPARRLVINWALIEQRRIAAGMTHAQLAARAGPGAVTGPPRLWTDNDHDAVPLGLLERLCQVLDLHPAELFQPPARAAQRRRALPPAGPPGDETVLEAALATVTTPSGQPGTPITPAALADALGWSLDRLDTALAALTGHLAGTGIRIDTDPAPAGTPLRGLRARDRHLSDEQRAALHRLRHATAPLDAGAARVLYAVAHPRGTLTEGDAPDPATVVALQQRGIIRRRPRAGYLELTDDARFSLAPEPPDPDGPLSL
jgi:DNA-binding Xre family transcriptional regulator